MVRNEQGNSSTAQVTITVVAADAPAIALGGVVDAASFTAGISAGGLASLFGVRLSGVFGIVPAQSIPLPVELQGTSITVNGVRAPLLAVANVNGSEQINFQVPVETAPGQARIVVSSGGHDSAPLDAPVLPAKPGVFMYAGTKPVIVHGTDQTLVTETSPARAGEVVVIYCTGLGAVAPAASTGNGASASVLSYVVLPVVVTVGGKEATVAFAGLTPNFVGLYQINVTIPSDLAGTSAPLTVEVGGSRSAQVSLPITQ
jgi:uncharacterized protein (TIGR03437 family)